MQEICFRVDAALNLILEDSKHLSTSGKLIKCFVRVVALAILILVSMSSKRGLLLELSVGSIGIGIEHLERFIINYESDINSNAW